MRHNEGKWLLMQPKEMGYPTSLPTPKRCEINLTQSARCVLSTTKEWLGVTVWKEVTSILCLGVRRIAGPILL